MANMQQLADLVPENNIIPEIQGEVPLDMLESDIDEDYSPVTPEQKIDLLKEDSREPMSEIFLDSVIGTAYLSTKECSETMSSSSSSLDTESGTYNLPPKHNLLQYENDDEVMKPKIINVDEKENIHLGNSVALKNLTRLEYEELLERVASYEIELKFAKEKLQSKQDEIAQLKYENLTLVEELDMTIENLRTSEDSRAKMEEEFRNELLETRHQLVSEVDSERKLVSELQGMLVNRTNDLGERGREIDELKHALHDAQEDFTKNREKMELEITYLHEQRDALDAQVKEAQLRNNFLEKEIKNYEMEKAELKGFHESQITGLLDEIKTLNKTLEGSRLMHETLEAEKHDVLAKMHTLEAEVNHRNTNIDQMEEHIGKLSVGIEEMVSELKRTREIAEELKTKVEDQEKELEKQRVVISERADEKREAIKQLCFSLEYYRNEYRELCQAFIKHKRPAVLAS